MGKRKLNLPPYRLSQELWNAISHGLGAVLALIGGGFLIDKACRSSDWVGIMSACIYVVGVFLMFLMSCLYHSLAKNRGKKVLRVLDHDFVFLPIMGTYTPYCLVGLHTVPGQSFPWGYVILAIVYAGCITGIALNSVSLRKFNTVVVALYVILGSTIVLAFYPLRRQKEPLVPHGVPFLRAGRGDTDVLQPLLLRLLKVDVEDNRAMVGAIELPGHR